MITRKQHKRVFFALWPDDTTRLHLRSTFQQSPYAANHALSYSLSNLHLTLHFMGSLQLSVIEQLISDTSNIKVSSFDLVLDDFGVFQRAGIFWIGPRHLPEQLLELHQLLGDVLTNNNIKTDARLYQPHVSLLRKFKLPPDGINHLPAVKSAVNWMVDRFALVESVSVPGGVVYQPLVEFMLS